MPVIQISRIQVRHGLQEDLPQLATAEFGWSLDTRRLYIGNGVIEEGAPSLGNTEILTQYSDIFSLQEVYTYKGERGTYIVKTGESALDPIKRTIQDKLDDYVSIRDFGGKGDGVADDTSAFNRAITELYRKALVGNQPLVRRELFVPAGRYLISGEAINAFPYLRIRGEGKHNTVIIQTDLAA